MERTTISFDSRLLRRLREEAARQDKNLSEVVNEMISGQLAQRKLSNGYSLKWGVEEGNRPPALDPADRDQLYDYLDERRR